MAKKIEISRQRIYRKYANFPKAYKIVHPETDTNAVMRGDDNDITLEDCLTDIEKLLKIINNYFDENGILKPAHGGSGGDNLPELLYKLITTSKTLDKDTLSKDDKIGVSDTSDKIGKGVTINELAQFIATLITTKPFVRSATAPSNTDIIWIDSGNRDIAKIYDPSAGWIAIKLAWA